MNARRIVFLLGLSAFWGDGCAASQSTLLIDIEGPSELNHSLGVSLYRELAPIRSGQNFSFLGHYDSMNNRIQFLDPPWIHVNWPRRMHWRIYFSIKTGRGSSQVISKHLTQDEAKIIVRLPRIKKYIKEVTASDHYNRSVVPPRLSLFEIYDGNVPSDFEHIDSHMTIAEVFCDNLGNQSPNIQQSFFVKPVKSAFLLNCDFVGIFTGSLHPNRPGLSYHEKIKKNIHHFNFKMMGSNPIKVSLNKETAQNLFVEEIKKVENKLRAICEKEGFTYRFNSLAGQSLTWFDERIVITGLITPFPSFSFEPVPYMVASVLIHPESGKPERIICGRRMRQDPPD